AVPPHKNPSKNPIKSPDARVGAREPEHLHPLQAAWHEVKRRLAESETFGEAKVEAWLNRLKVGRLDAGTVTLIAPTRFIASFVGTNHADLIVGHWRQIDADVVQLRVEPAADMRRGSPLSADAAAASPAPRMRRRPLSWQESRDAWRQAVADLNASVETAAQDR